MEKTPKQICEARDLQPGDRFHFLSDKKRLVYQVVERKWKELLYIDAAVADRKNVTPSSLPPGARHANTTGRWCI